MKIKAFLLSALAMLVMTTSFANPVGDSTASKTGNKYKKLRTKLIEKVESVKDKFNFQKNEEVHICFIIQENGNIEVQDVISKNKELALVIKEQLDQEEMEVKTENYEVGISYWITLDYTVL